MEKSILVFTAFGMMFYKMSMKHTKRIKGYEEEYRPVWHFLIFSELYVLIHKRLV